LDFNDCVTLFEVMENLQKCRERLRALGSSALAVLFMSCVTTAAPSTASISYTPENMVQPVKDAGAVTITVNDLRANRGKVGNTTGMIPKAGNGVITTAESVTVIVKTAAESELRNRGFTLSGGTASVKIDVSEFDVQHVILLNLLLLQSYNSEAKALMHVEVTGVGGKQFYSRLVFGQDDSDQNSDEQTLDLALQTALRDLFADPNFIGAILAAEQGQPNKR
jgi:uncharacterized lipoprotein YajG